MAYLGYSDGLDFAVAGDSIFVWARGAWHKFCLILDWVSRWPAQGITKMLWHGVWIGLKTRDALLSYKKLTGRFLYGKLTVHGN